MHGAAFIRAPLIELNHARDKSPAGVVVYRDTLLKSETVILAGHAGDLSGAHRVRPGPSAREWPRFSARLPPGQQDPDPRTFSRSRQRIPGQGRRRVAGLLDLVDAGAQSPKETWLRLLSRPAFPGRGRRSSACPDGYPRYFLDMGWEESGRWRPSTTASNTGLIPSSTAPT